MSKANLIGYRWIARARPIRDPLNPSIIIDTYTVRYEQGSNPSLSAKERATFYSCSFAFKGTLLFSFLIVFSEEYVYGQSFEILFHYNSLTYRV